MNKDTILIVDDSTMIIEELKSCLEKNGFSTSVATSNSQVFRELTDKEIDLVLINLKSTKSLNSVKIANLIRDHFQLDCIYLTSYSDEKLLERSRLTEPFAYIEKPFKEKELIYNIKLAFQKVVKNKKLKEKEARYRALVKAVPEIILEIDLKGTIIWMNDIARDYLGSDALHQHHKDYFDLYGDDSEGAEQAWAKIHTFLKGEVNLIEIRSILTRKDGNTRIVQWYSKALKNNNQISGMLMTGRDITEKLKNRKQLSETKALLEGVLNNIQDMLIVLKPDKTLIRMNSVAHKFHNQRDYVGEKCYKYIGNGEPCEDCVVDKTLRSKKVEETEIYRAKWDKYWYCRCYPIFDQDGEIKQLVEQIQDITRQKKAAIALRKSEQKYRSLFTHMLDGFAYMEIIKDKDGRPLDMKFIEVNDAFRSYFNISPTKVVGKKASQVFPGLESLDYNLIEIYANVAETGKSIRIKSIYLEALNRWFTISAYSLEPGYCVSVFYDITEQKVAQRKIKEEIDKASLLHKRLLTTKFPSIDELSFAAHYKPAQQLGGDFYNVMKIEDHLLFYLVDVSGHGLDGAMVNIFIRDTINSYLLSEKDELLPSKILEFLVQKYNKEDFPGDYFICIQIGVLNLHTKELRISNAGIQINPLLISASGEVKAIPCEGLPISSSIEPQLLDYSEDIIFLNQGTTLILTTDGLIEQKRGRELYGEKRLHQVAARNYQLSSDGLVNAINEDFRKFNGDLQGDDDITYLIIKNIFPITARYSEVIRGGYKEINQLEDNVMDIIKLYTDNYARLRIGLHEMLINAVEHGNQSDFQKEVEIKIEVSDTTIRLVVKDEGKGFNWHNKIKNELEFDNGSERGRGIILTEMCFDYIYYNTGGNQVTLIKIR